MRVVVIEVDEFYVRIGFLEEIHHIFHIGHKVLLALLRAARRYAHVVVIFVGYVGEVVNSVASAIRRTAAAVKMAQSVTAKAEVGDLYVLAVFKTELVEKAFVTYTALLCEMLWSKGSTVCP